MKNRFEAQSECREICDSMDFLTTIATLNDATPIKNEINATENSTFFADDKFQTMIDLNSNDPFDQYSFHTGIDYNFNDGSWKYRDFWFFERQGSTRNS